MKTKDMNRRKFLALSTAAIAGSIFCPNLAFLKTTEAQGRQYAILANGYLCQQYEDLGFCWAVYSLGESLEYAPASRSAKSCWLR